MSGVRKLGPAFVASIFGEFLLFDNFFDFSLCDFPNLDGFQDLADFWPFNFLDFLASSTPSPSTPSPP